MARIFLPGSRQDQLQQLARLLGGLTQKKLDDEYPPVALNAPDVGGSSWAMMRERFLPGGAVRPGTPWDGRLDGVTSPDPVRTTHDPVGRRMAALRRSVEVRWTAGRPIDQYELTEYTRMALPGLYCPREYPDKHFVVKPGHSTVLQNCRVVGQGPDRRIGAAVTCAECQVIVGVMFAPYAV